MPIEFTQYPPQENTEVSGDTLYKMAMAYDGSGRRISKTRWVKARGDAGWSREHVTHYTGIGTEIRENMPGGTLKDVRVVVNMPNGLGRYGVEDAADAFRGVPLDENGKPTSWSALNPKFEWYLKNHLGSTMLVYSTAAYDDSYFSNFEGGVKAAYDYRAFGEQIDLVSPSSGKVTENFTGKEKDDETQLNYFGARYLDPMLGMWISVDKARQFDSPYLYMGNGTNPIKLNDPDGNAVPIIVAFGLVIVRNIAVRVATQAVARATVAAVPVAMKAVDLAQKAQLPQNLKYAAAAGAASAVISNSLSEGPAKTFDETIDNMGNIMTDPASAVFGTTRNLTQDVLQNPPNVKGLVNEVGDALNQGLEDFSQGMSKIGDAFNQGMNGLGNAINQNVNNGISENVKNALNQ